MALDYTRAAGGGWGEDLPSLSPGFLVWGYLLNGDPVRINVNIYSTMTGVRRQSKSETAQAHSIPGTQVNINHILHLHVSLFGYNSFSTSSPELSPKPESEWMSLCF